MPELPEVETTRRGIAPHIVGSVVTELSVHNGSLRWPVPADLSEQVVGQKLLAVDRRAKYLLFNFSTGSALLHLGMSGSLRLAEPGTPRRLHDHIEWQFANGARLRYHDPRRFGCCLWSGGTHSQLAALGPEPLDPEFNAERLWHRSRGRKVAVKPFIMDNATVVGVGNIYATEALFNAGIRPDRAAGSISRKRYQRLAEEIVKVLSAAIEQGGTTLRDFVNGNGEPGYFAQQLSAYGRAGEACLRCAGKLREQRLGQRSSVFCPRCQR
ncbi:bifunctional DNA-formamidopyrimidine glycosylase/DNA-(apurinic or apyrimidinic site) lyase [Porticoccaceae bacterium]|nr:bifunctional DNA-formamidopyrimidine glycosylase/DNA-(apurinic or apyrimidinic site) lyase [Porticoccaceae bacterium]